MCRSMKQLPKQSAITNLIVDHTCTDTDVNDHLHFFSKHGLHSAHCYSVIMTGIPLIIENSVHAICIIGTMTAAGNSRRAYMGSGDFSSDMC
jgi:hypothetical protein